jgi:gliding motility-associated-like protein
VIAVPGLMNSIPLFIQSSCQVPDTLNVRVVSPYPAFDIDTAETPKFKMTNKSDTSLNIKYEWVVYKSGSSTILFNGSGNNNNRDFAFDLQDDTGSFVVCLTSFANGINLADACSDSVCNTVKNTYNPDLQIPNVFSPNGDGSNDVLRIPHESVQKFKITIYNRWGAKVFETGDVEKYWNGKVNNDGADSPAGVYYYIAEYKLRGLEDKTRTGTITLIR